MRPRCTNLDEMGVCKMKHKDYKYILYSPTHGAYYHGGCECCKETWGSLGMARTYPTHHAATNAAAALYDFAREVVTVKEIAA